MSDTKAFIRGAGLVLPVGGTVDTPNAGEVALCIQSDGTAGLKQPDGTTEDLGGGGTVVTDGVTLDGVGSIGNPLTALPIFSYLWRLDVMRRIVGLFPAAGFNSLCWSSDCNNITAELVLAAATNSGDAVLESVTNGGSILTSTGATNNSARVVNARDSITTSPAVRFVSNSRTQVWAMYARAQLVATPGAGGKFCVIANLQDGTNDNYIGGHGTTSATNWVISIGGAFLDTTVAFDTDVHDFLLVNDGTNIRGYLDWVQIGSAVAVAGVAVDAGWPRFYDFNGTTGQNVSHRTFRIAMAVAEPEPS